MGMADHFIPIVLRFSGRVPPDWWHGLPDTRIISLSTPRRSWSLVFLVSAALTSCANPEYVSERPVENSIPPLKPGVYRIESVDVRPKSTKEVEPEYPFELESILSGTAVVVFTVHVDGKVSDASVVRADDVLFGEAALSAIKKWRFRPAEVKGSPVDCMMTLPFYFSSPAGYSQGDSGPGPDGRKPDNSVQATVQPR
jgi:TonB family protein